MVVAGAGERPYDFVREPKKLEVLHRKGLFSDCKTMEDVNRARHNSNHPQFKFRIDAIVPGRRQLEAKKTLLSFEGYQVGLDRIAAPELERKPPWVPATLAALEKVLDFKPVETDPFRYCPEGAEGGRFAVRAVWLEDSMPVPVLIRVAVGYDYVGEWKRKNGK